MLAVLLPVVAGQGGDTGAQAPAVAMRGIALREIASGATKRVLLKETLGGLAKGVVVAPPSTAKLHASAHRAVAATCNAGRA